MSVAPVSGSAQVNADVPATQVPIVDKEGKMTPQFYRFLVALLARTGGPAGTSTTQIVNEITQINTLLTSAAAEAELALFLATSLEDQGTGQKEGFGLESISQSLELPVIPGGVSGAMLLALAAFANTGGSPVTTNVITLLASENLSAGALVNVWDNGGVASLRNADNSSPAKQADGFVLTATLSGTKGVVGGPGQLDYVLSGLTPGLTYFLGTVGAITSVVPTGVGVTVQVVGKALSGTELWFLPEPGN